MATTAAQAASQPAKPSPKQVNAAARSLILDQAQNMMQQIFSLTVVPANQNVINVPLRNVGLVKGLLCELTATVSNSDGTNAQNATNWNVANLLSQIVFTDTSNNTRVNTAGWHMHAINSAKRRRPYAGVTTLSSMPIKYGNNYSTLIQAPATVAKGSPTTGTLNMLYYVPLSYSDHDLRGSLYMGVVNATAQLQLTINPAPGATNTGDPTLAIYQNAAGSTLATLSSVTVNVYQHYLDQLPSGNQGIILPPLDISTIYELKNTNLTGMVVGQDFPMPFANFRDFLSTTIIYDNGGSNNAGTDVNYWALQAANQVNYYKVDPTVQVLSTRNELGTDFPAATYYFNHRGKPISTLQYGNQSIIGNFSTVNTGAVALIGYEDFAYVNTVMSAGSLPGG